MTAHKHAEMIKAKADNMELVVFRKDFIGSWFESSLQTMIAKEDIDFFLCLPEHKEACSHWLNGGDIEYKNELAPRGWGAVSSIKESIEEDMEGGEELWSDRVYFMRTDLPIRIKPRKERLWLAVKTDKHEHLGGCRKVRICSHAFVNKQDAVDYLDLDSAQLIEIEVEV